MFNFETQGPLQKRERTSTSLVGEISVSFKLPDDCAINAQEVDKVVFLLHFDIYGQWCTLFVDNIVLFFFFDEW